MIHQKCHQFTRKQARTFHMAANVYTSEVCAGLRFVSGSRQGVEISARLPARLPGDSQLWVPAWSRGKNFLSSPGPGPGALLSSPGLSIPAGNPGVPDMEQY